MFLNQHSSFHLPHSINNITSPLKSVTPIIKTSIKLSITKQVVMFKALSLMIVLSVETLLACACLNHAEEHIPVSPVASISLISAA